MVQPRKRAAMVLPDPATLVRRGAPPTGASMRMFSSLRFCLVLLILLCSGRSPCSRDNHYLGTTSSTSAQPRTYTRLLSIAGKKYYFHKFVRVTKFGAAESYGTARRLELYRMHARGDARDRSTPHSWIVSSSSSPAPARAAASGWVDHGVGNW
jgi:hypothetical protein